MKNLDLLQSQPSTNNQPHHLLTTEPNLPKLDDENVNILTNIPETGLSELMKKAKAVRYVRAEAITTKINENSLLVIFNGETCVSKSFACNNEEITFHVKEPNPDFGEIALISDTLRSNSSITLKNALFAHILKTEFNHWLLNYQDTKLTCLSLLPVKLNS